MMIKPKQPASGMQVRETKHLFRLRILGRMLEHLGVQMYKKRDAALAELVANCWDAGAENVWITIPSDVYVPSISKITLEDDGCGMDKEALQDKYLVIGRNRVKDEQGNVYDERRVMGKKGIGKLAGFGIATKMTVETWKDDSTVRICLNLSELSNPPTADENPEKTIQGTVTNGIPDDLYGSSGRGTRVILSDLKSETPPDLDSLHQSLSRRFSRSVKGRMAIKINGEDLRPFVMDYHQNSPKLDIDVVSDTLGTGERISYSYAFTEKPIRYNELRGWTIHINGKTAQAPNFFFDVESKGASQHSAKYLIGWVEADYLDRGLVEDIDLISTDRQEIDWEQPQTKGLWEWGKKKTQEIFLTIAERNAETNVNIIMTDPSLRARIDRLDPESKKKVIQFVKSIGTIKIENEETTDLDRIRQLGDQIIKAFEYRHFVDVVDDIEKAGNSSPEELQTLLNHLAKWEVLESRSILEVIRGRLTVIDKFYTMIVDRAPETANRQIDADNFHDLIAGFPWLLNPEWQIFVEEKTISRILKEKGKIDFDEAMKAKRVDFLGLVGSHQGVSQIAIIEIKSPGSVLQLEEVRRLEDYKVALQPAHKERLVCVLVYSGVVEIDEDIWKNYRDGGKDYFVVREWKEILQRNRQYYEHYRGVLEHHISDPSFELKEEEVIQTRRMLEKGTVKRTPEDRQVGLGPQDVAARVE